MVNFNFESISMLEDKFRDTNTTTRIGKQVPISVAVPTNLIEKPVFLCNFNPGASVESSVDAFGGWATQRKTQTKLEFLEFETSVKSKLNQSFSALSQRRCRKELLLEFEDDCIEEEKQDMSRQFSQTQRFSLWICRIIWILIATFLMPLASTAQKRTLN